MFSIFCVLFCTGTFLDKIMIVFKITKAIEGRLILAVSVVFLFFWGENVK